MKKTVTATIIISLVMCLTMSFPASAAKYTELNVPSYLAFYNTVIQRATTAGYTYIAFFHNVAGGANLAIASKTESVVNGNEIALYQQSTGGGSFYSNGGKFTFTNFAYSGGAINIPLNSSGQIVNYNSYYYFPEISTIDFSRITSTYCRTLTNISPLPDISALQALLTQAKAKPNTGYTQSSWQSLQTQITAADNLLATTGYTQAQIDSAKTSLQSALDGLSILPDTSELQALVTIADTVENEGYSNPTWNRFATARTNAHVLLAAPEYTVSQVTATKTELQVSMDNLRLLPDSSALESLIEHAQTYIDDKYTELSLQILNSKIMQALILLGDKDYMTSQIENMIEEITAAINGLVLVQSLDPPIIDPPITKPPIIIVEGDKWYSLSNEQKKYSDLTDGVTPEHLEPIKDAVVDNIQVARQYGLWVYIITLLPLVAVYVIISFVRKGDDDYVSIDMSAPQLNGRHLESKPDRKLLK